MNLRGSQFNTEVYNMKLDEVNWRKEDIYNPHVLDLNDMKHKF